MKRSLSLFLCVLALVGCAKDAAKPGTEAAKPSEPAAATDPKAPAAVVKNEVPAELMHDGFEYYGLGNGSAIDLDVKSSLRNMTLTGSQTSKLIEVKDGKALFSVERTGGLTTLGVNKLSVGKDGVYVVESSVAKITTPKLEMPAKLAPGVTWKSDLEVDVEGRKMKESTVNTVVGPEKVKTKRGEMDALLITVKGTGVIDGQNVRIDGKSWQVKGLGLAKMEVTTTFPDGKKDVTTMEVGGPQ